jgi:carbohydrate diacid regulator
MNHEGVILGSGDPARIGETHDGARQVIESNQRVDIDEDNARKLKGTNPGVNLPIMFQGEIAGVIGITGPPQEIGSYSELVKMGAELTLEQAFLTEQIQWEERLKEDMVKQLILGNPYEDRLFKERARRMNINLNLDRVAIVIEITPTSPKAYEVSSQKLWRKLHSQLMNLLKEEDLIARTSPSELVILKAITLKEGQINLVYLKQKLKDIVNQLAQTPHLTVNVSLGKYYSTVDKINFSYQLALETLKVGKALSPDDSIYIYDEYAFSVLLSDIKLSEKHNELVERFEVLLKHDTKGELLETLYTYVQENGDITKTSNQLFIHRNTLGYRLKRIYELTKRDPRKVQELMELYTAMMLSKLT